MKLRNMLKRRKPAEPPSLNYTAIAIAAQTECARLDLENRELRREVARLRYRIGYKQRGAE